MKHEVDLKKYQIRTDLLIENLDDLDKSKSKNNIYKDIKVTSVTLNKEDALKINKKEGTYITIEFDDITDEVNAKNVTKVLEKCLKKLFKIEKIKENDTCLVIGLGNISSTPDSLGPLVIQKVTVTRHLFLIDDVDPSYRSISAYAPGVTGNSGIETLDIINGIVDKIKPNFVIVIDALASMSIERLNKTIQMSNTGINPGSGIGNSRKEISYDTLRIPVISIGVPTVVDAVSVVSDTINYIHKNYAFNKKFIGSPLNRLVSSTKINYLKENITIDEADKTSLLGLVGSLSETEVRQLIYEVLTPIGYNLMVTVKEIDFVIIKLAEIISEAINFSTKKTT